MTSFFPADGGPIWIKFCRLVQDDMSTAMIWSKSKPGVEFQYRQYGGRLGEFMACHPRVTCHIAGCCHLANSMSSSQSYVSHCRVPPLNEFTIVIPEPHATFQGAVTWRYQCHDRATLQDVRIHPPYWKSFFAIFYFILFLKNSVWALTSGGFRIVSDTLVTFGTARKGLGAAPNPIRPGLGNFRNPRRKFLCCRGVGILSDQLNQTLWRMISAKTVYNPSRRQ